MTLMSAAQLAERLGGVANGTTLRRWALEGRIRSSYRLPNGRVVFTEAAIEEILKPTSKRDERLSEDGEHRADVGD